MTKKRVLSDIVPNLGMWDDLPAAKSVAILTVGRVSTNITAQGTGIRNAIHRSIRRAESIKNELRYQIKNAVKRALAMRNGEGALEMRGDVNLLSPAEISDAALEELIEVFSP